MVSGSDFPQETNPLGEQLGDDLCVLRRANRRALRRALRMISLSVFPLFFLATILGTYKGSPSYQ